MAKTKSATTPIPTPSQSTAVSFDVSHYEAEHGQVPETAVRDWSFLPPPHCGKRPWVFVNMTLGEAKAAAIAEIGERGVHGVFVVTP